MSKPTYEQILSNPDNFKLVNDTPALDIRKSRTTDNYIYVIDGNRYYDGYITLKDIRGSLVYESHNSAGAILDSEISEKYKTMEVHPHPPTVYKCVKEIKGCNYIVGNCYFVSDETSDGKRNVFDEFICLYDVCGKLVWDEHKNNEGYFFKTLKNITGNLIRIYNSPLAQAIFGFSGIVPKMKYIELIDKTDFTDVYALLKLVNCRNEKIVNIIDTLDKWHDNKNLITSEAVEKLKKQITDL